jgi:serine/threonine protein kinase
MGVVWAARDEYLRRDVAVKEVQLRAGSGAGESAVPRTLREARAAAKLRHPGIVTVHDVVTDDGRPWIVMELIGGRSLADVLREDGPLSERRAAEIGIEVLSALDAAHQRGVLHRDVKPGNVMLDGDRVVLTDFGIAVIDGATAITGTGQLIGSPEYIAPERIDGHDATYAADLWAVGVTLYNVVVGRSPFHRTDRPATLVAIVARDPAFDPRISQLWPVIQGLLRKNPAERLTAKAATSLLSQVVDGPSAPAPVVSVPPPDTRLEHPHAQITVPRPTAVNTRTAPPPLPPDPHRTVPSVAHGDETIDPVSGPGPPNRVNPVSPVKRTPWVAIAAAIVVLAAIAATVIVLTSAPDKNSTAEPSATSVAPPALKQYQEPLGFTIGVPADWNHSASAVSALSDVVWQGQQLDPTVGALKVQVQRDGTMPGVTAYTYLSEKDRIGSVDGNNANYRRIALTLGPGNTAELESAHSAAAGGKQFHQYRKAMVSASGSMYVLTFSLDANDAQTLQTQWQASQPVMTAVRDSFKITA